MGERNIKELSDLTFKFALAIVKYSNQLEDMKRFELARHILRSGVSIGAIIKQTEKTDGKIDFNHKIKVSTKEAEEIQYWLLICKASEELPNCDGLIIMVEQIIKLLTEITNAGKRSIGFSSQV
jgi:four helix bundle protein